jgi:glycopeptide antibiotics resistance protein
VYIVVLVYLLFFCDRYGRTVQYDTIKYNLVPFAEIRRYIMNWECFTAELFVANIAGNVGLFVPFGAMLFVLKGKPVSFLEVTFCACALSVVIELVQLITRVGVCDVDDMILNTVGGMIGYFVYLLVRTIVRRRTYVKRQKKL